MLWSMQRRPEPDLHRPHRLQIEMIILSSLLLAPHSPWIWTWLWWIQLKICGECKTEEWWPELQFISTNGLNWILPLQDSNGSIFPSAKHIGWQSQSSQIPMQKSIFCIENKYLLRFIFSPLWQWQQTWLSGSGTIADGNFSQDHLNFFYLKSECWHQRSSFTLKSINKLIIFRY